MRAAAGESAAGESASEFSAASEFFPAIDVVGSVVMARPKGGKLDAKASSSAPPPAHAAELQLLGTYVRIWALNSLCRVLTGPGKELVGKYPVACCLAVAFSFPESPLAVLLGFGARAVAILRSYPYVHDSQNWSLQTDLAVLVAFASVLLGRRRRGGGLFARFGDAEAASWRRAASATVYWQYLFFYTAAALWKANEGFMSPRFSCAPIYLVQIAEAYVPAGLIADNPWAIEMITAWAPAVVLLVEALVPLLLWADVRAGIAFAGLFHWTIAITPPPNDIANFGASRRAHTRAVIVTPARRDPSASSDSSYLPSARSQARRRCRGCSSWFLTHRRPWRRRAPSSSPAGAAS